MRNRIRTLSREPQTVASATMSSKRLLLVGMTMTDVNRRAELEEHAHQHNADLAFLQLAEPHPQLLLDRYLTEAVETVTVVGIKLGDIGPAHSWLRRILGHWWRETPGTKPVLNVATSLASELDAVPEVVADTKPITGSEAPLTSEAWENIPSYRHQVLVCRGPRCAAKGSDENLRSMVKTMMENGLGDDDALIVHTGCQFPCNHAPIVTVQPDDVWYGNVDPEAAARIVTEHFVDGNIVDDYRIHRDL